MNIGSRIRTFREARKLTQQALAEKVNVSFQAVSSWERGEYVPETEKIAALAEALDVSMSQILEEETPAWELKDRIFNERHMYTFLSSLASAKHFTQMKRALPYARDAHKCEVRKGGDVPYINHPLTMACHACAMRIEDDAVLAAIILHDVLEDCGIVKPEELPVEEEAKELVRLLTKKKVPAAEKANAEKRYYETIAKNPKAAFIKCLDRVNNVSGMAAGFTRKKMAEYIAETETYIVPLLDVVRNQPEYNNAAWLMKYQLTALLETQKRLL